MSGYRNPIRLARGQLPILAFQTWLLGALVHGALALPAHGQTRIMPLGDSITHGGQGYASYRYELWFDLVDSSFVVNLVGQRDAIFGGDPPNLDWYPEYLTSFDRDHEGYWGWRTDEIASIVLDAAAAGQPDIVLIHLGTNDIGQMGPAGVTNADTNLRLIVERVRSVNPAATVLLAQVIPIGPGTSYFQNADQVAPLNAVIAAVAADLTSTESPVILVDQNTGFDLDTMMQSDGLHPNLPGEAQMAGVWADSLATRLPVGNPPPEVEITSPPDGAVFFSPTDITIEADASDPDGFVIEVSFYDGAVLLGTDDSEPYTHEWIGVPIGGHTLTAVAKDDQGATRTSDPVGILVRPPGDGAAISITNPSFEDPPLPDGVLAGGPGVIGGWSFEGTPETYVGIFNPPAGSYPGAEGDGTPAGADGANVAYLFNNADSVSATQVLADTLEPGVDYALTVAIGKFLPDQPYVFSTYGGYVIELRAGSTVIARDEDAIEPPVGMFRDALAFAPAVGIDSALVGQALSIRLDISATEMSRSTHFDLVRLTGHEPTTGIGLPDTGSNPGLPPLLAVSPNPFRPGTTITYSVETSGMVSVTLFDVGGSLVERLVPARFHRSGVYRVAYERSPGPGIYLVRLVVGGQVRTRKLVDLN